ncbi:hypothetical protein K1719_023073 [Acacia pycnantha]|nr:hypothetical protein K1719_023073 [Acacia pycnantha]
MSYSMGGSDQQPPKRILRTQKDGNLGLDPILDNEVVPSSLVEITPILLVANEIESSNPRVSYLYSITDLCKTNEHKSNSETSLLPLIAKLALFCSSFKLPKK